MKTKWNFPSERTESAVQWLIKTESTGPGSEFVVLQGAAVLVPAGAAHRWDVAAAGSCGGVWAAPGDGHVPAVWGDPWGRVLWGEPRGVGRPLSTLRAWLCLQAGGTHRSCPHNSPHGAQQQRSQGIFWALQACPEDISSFSSLKFGLFALSTHGKINRLVLC